MKKFLIIGLVLMVGCDAKYSLYKTGLKNSPIKTINKEYLELVNEKVQSGQWPEENLKIRQESVRRVETLLDK